MSLSRAHLLLVVLFLTLPLRVVCQEAAQLQPEETPATQHAIELLDLVSENLSTLRSFENRVYVASYLADLLWTRDEKRARSLFETVTKEMAEAAADLETPHQQADQKMPAFQQQRREILELLARRDPEMALAFLRATRLPPESEYRSGHYYQNETSLEIHLAGLIAAKNPQQAIKMGRAILKKGVNSQLTALLHQIAAADPSAAQTFYKEIVFRLKQEDLLSNHNAANAGWNLLGSFSAAQVDEASYRELLEFLTSYFLPAASNASARRSSYVQNFQHLMNSAMPQVEKYIPARMPALRQLTASTLEPSDPAAKMHRQLTEITQNGTVDDLLSMASKHTAEFQGQIYQHAIWKAANSGDAARARQIASELITDPRQRRQMLEQLDNHLLWKVINENKIAEARELLSKSRHTDHRIQTLVNLAVSANARKEKSLAVELLAEARALMETLPSSLAKITAQLHLAQGYASLDPEQSSALMQPIIGSLNQFVSAAVVLDGIENRYLQDGEWTKRGHSGLANLVNNLQQNLSALARHDPARARSLANEFERPELRIISQLEIARTLLAGEVRPLRGNRRMH
jgi:hypothetical protein